MWRDRTCDMLECPIDCCRLLTDRPRLTNKHAQTRHTTPSTAISIRQFGIIFFRWMRREQVNRRRAREKNVSSTWAPAPLCCRILRQWAERFHAWRLVNCWFGWKGGGEAHWLSVGPSRRWRRFDSPVRQEIFLPESTLSADSFVQSHA